MTDGVWEVVGQNDQELPLGTTIGDALRRLIRRRFEHNTAKSIEKKWKLDAKTAKNVVERGCVSERTLTKAALSERWSLWMALGEELFEETYDEFLESIVHEQDRIRQRAAERREHVRRLEASAGEVVRLGAGMADREDQ